LDDGFLDELEGTTRDLLGRSRTSAPAYLLPVVRGQLAVLSTQMVSSPTTTLHRRLHSIAGQTAELAGWLSYLVDNHGDARTFYTLALRLADECGDKITRAMTLTALSLLHSKLGIGNFLGRSGESLDFLDEAHRAAVGSARTESWVLARRAEERAVNGDLGGSYRDLDQALHAVARMSTQTDAIAGNFDSTWIAGYRGTCALLLGRAGEAAHNLEEAVSATSPALVADGCVLLIDLAAAYGQSGDIDRACALLTQSLDNALRNGLGSRIHRIRAVRQGLSWAENSAPVRELDDRVRSLVP
jgi:tetratricopeptide (TPR) repeat protein